jgi:hypothetical protein
MLQPPLFILWIGMFPVKLLLAWRGLQAQLDSASIAKKLHVYL